MVSFCVLNCPGVGSSGLFLQEIWHGGCYAKAVIFRMPSAIRGFFTCKKTNYLALNYAIEILMLELRELIMLCVKIF